jgi:starch synthase
MVRYKSRGILNGIDTEVWMWIKCWKNYSIENRKANNRIKGILCTLFRPYKTAFSFIGRLLEGDSTGISFSLSENYKEINILILGSGNQEIEDQLNSLLIL